MEKDSSREWKRQESRGCNTHIRQNRLSNKGHKERQRRTLSHDKRISSRRGYYTCQYALNMGAPKNKQQIVTDIKGGSDGNTIIVGDFTTALTLKDRPSRQKIDKATEIQNDTTEQLDSIDIFRHYIKKNQNIHSPQVHMECSQGLTTYRGTKLTSTNLRV